MSQYVDKNKVLEHIIFGVVGKDITCGELTRSIESLPTIDIVHCGECRHWATWDMGEHFCGHLEGGIGGSANDFCSYGERIEE